ARHRPRVPGEVLRLEALLGSVRRRQVRAVLLQRGGAPAAAAVLRRGPPAGRGSAALHRSGPQLQAEAVITPNSQLPTPNKLPTSKSQSGQLPGEVPLG